MAVFYPFPDQIPIWQVLGASLLIIIISVAVIVMVKRLPYLFVGWLWYAITILPVIGIIQIGTDPMADRYTYLPSDRHCHYAGLGYSAFISEAKICAKRFYFRQE